jgi:phenylpropionate dioxygenase-like ring-hydroxylating dioxygenase large terminal subunit
MEKICLELPIINVDRSQNWSNEEYAKEHEFPKDKPFIADDGACYWFCIFDGRWVNQIVVPKDIFETRLAKMAEDDILGQTKDIISQLCNGLEYIQRLTKECKDEVVKSDTRIMDELSIQRDAEAHEFTLIMEGMKGLHEAMPKNVVGGGVNILDVAKSYAVIQKPELIKEL